MPTARQTPLRFHVKQAALISKCQLAIAAEPPAVEPSRSSGKPRSANKAPDQRVVGLPRALDAADPGSRPEWQPLVGVAVASEIHPQRPPNGTSDVAAHRSSRRPPRSRQHRRSAWLEVHVRESACASKPSAERAGAAVTGRAPYSSARPPRSRPRPRGSRSPPEPRCRVKAGALGEWAQPSRAPNTSDSCELSPYAVLADTPT